MSDRDLEAEEAFHERDRKQFRKERRILSKTDRSKFKKTDLEKEKKTVPKGENLSRGRILAILSDGILVESDEKLFTCSIRGALKKNKSRQKNLVAVGDFVQFTQIDEQTGCIDFVEKRRSALSRAEHGARRREQLIAVNVDQVLITVSVVLPPLKPALIDRYIIAAKKGNMEPVIVINKIDLLKDHPDEKALFEDVVATYRAIPLPVFPISAETGEGVDALFRAMDRKSSVFSGQSGTGKSSLINALIGANLKTGDVIERTRKGAHTTSSTCLLPIGDHGFCVDTPGIKSFGMTKLEPADVEDFFTEIAEVGKHCRFPNCSHIHEPDCAVRLAVESEEISHLRFDSYSALIASLVEDKPKR